MVEDTKKIVGQINIFSIRLFWEFPIVYLAPVPGQ